MGSSTKESWRLQINKLLASYKTALQTGDFSELKKKADNPKYTHDEMKLLAGDFPEIKTVMEDLVNYHQALADEYQSVTDDLESGQADKPTAIERVRSQGEKLKAESAANTDASGERVVALIDGLPEDQQQRAADFWETLFLQVMVFWSQVLVQFEQIFEAVVEWLSQVWEQVKTCWGSVKGVLTEIWAWLASLTG
jgi:hypothetical protein